MPLLAMLLFVNVGIPAPVLADFDRDGLNDVALVASEGRSAYKLIVVRAANPDHPAIIYRMRRARGFHMSNARPGTYSTNCGKYFRRHCRYRTVTLTRNDMVFGDRGGSRAAVIWAHRRFEIVWLTDKPVEP